MLTILCVTAGFTAGPAVALLAVARCVGEERFYL